MVVEETVYEDDQIRAYTEKTSEGDEKKHHCSCGRAVCCGKHRNCPNARNFVRIRKTRQH